MTTRQAGNEQKILQCGGVQARPSSAGDGIFKAAAQEAALAAVEEEWSARLAEALALCQDQEVALERTQRQSLRVRRCVLPFAY